MHRLAASRNIRNAAHAASLGRSRCLSCTVARSVAASSRSAVERFSQAVATTTISQLSSSSGPPPPARNVTSWKPAASSHTTHSGGVGSRTKYEARRTAPSRCTVRSMTMRPVHRVEGRDLDHGVVTVLDDHRVGRRGEVADAAVVVHRVDGHLPARPEDAVELRQDAVAVGVVVVAERVEPAHDRVERAVDREVAEVPLQVRDGVAGCGADRRAPARGRPA